MIAIEELYQKFQECSVIATDTRKLSSGCMFFALKGENFNGNTFAEKAIENGARYAIIDEEEFAEIPNTILVKDVLKSLQDLANHHRNQYNIPFLGITGSNGKTTTKELIRDVLKKKFNVLATKGNLNNHIGVPLTLLELNEQHDFAIIEMGANHQGEIEELCRIADPNYGMITNIGKAHIEGFGGVEGIKKGKSELYRHIESKEGLIFVNANDEVLIELLKGYQKTYTYGSEGSDVELSLIKSSPSLSINWKRGDASLPINLKIYGAYNFSNASAAVAIGNYFGVESGLIVKALEDYQSQNNRSQLVKSGSTTVYLDAYNANPSSMVVALKSFFEVDSDSKAVILGDMLELGEDAIMEHQKIIELLSENYKGRVFLVGKIFKEAAMGTSYSVFVNTEALIDELKLKGVGASSILVKGSRMIGLERTIDYLK